LSERYVTHQKATAKISADYEKVRKELAKVCTLSIAGVFVDGSLLMVLSSCMYTLSRKTGHAYYVS